MVKKEQAYVEMIQIYTSHWVFRYRLIIYDKLTKSKVSEYGLFHSPEEAFTFAQEHHINVSKEK